MLLHHLDTNIKWYYNKLLEQDLINDNKTSTCVANMKLVSSYNGNTVSVIDLLRNKLIFQVIDNLSLVNQHKK